MDQVVASCRQHGKAAGIDQVDPDGRQVAAVIDKGFSFVAIGMDNVFLGKAAAEGIAAARKAIGERS